MKTLPLDLGERSYPIYIGAGLLGQADLLNKHIAGSRVAIVTNETVAPLYAARLQGALADAGAQPMVITLPDGEAYKDWKTLDREHLETARAFLSSFRLRPRPAPVVSRAR